MGGMEGSGSNFGIRGITICDTVTNGDIRSVNEDSLVKAVVLIGLREKSCNENTL